MVGIDRVAQAGKLMLPGFCMTLPGLEKRRSRMISSERRFYNPKCRNEFERSRGLCLPEMRRCMC